MQGNLKETLKKIEIGLKTKGLNKEEELNFLLLKSQTMWFFGKHQESIQFADQVLDESEGLNNILIQVDALYQKAFSLLNIAKPKEVDKIIERGNKLLSTASNLPANKIDEAKAKLLLVEGIYMALLGDFVKCEELHQKSISYAEKSSNKYLTQLSLGSLGAVHILFDIPIEGIEFTEKALTISTDMGYKFWTAFLKINLAGAKSFEKEFDLAIKLYEEAFTLAEEIGSPFLYSGYYDMGITYHLMFQLDKALECLKESLKYYLVYEHIAYGKIGYIYFLKYELRQAQEYLLKSLKLCKKLGDKNTLSDVLYNLILIFIELKNLNKANLYLEQLEEISTETDFEYISQKYRFASILVLKESGDISNLGKAAELLKTYLQEKDLHSKLRFDALYSLLEIRLKELQLSVNQEALREVQKRLHHLEVEAEEQDQKWLLANVYRLHSQLVLVELDAKRAIDYLDQAQIIADEIDIELLKKEIREDREKIQQQLAMWNNLQEQKAPISETVKLVSLESTVKNIKEETVLEEKDKETGEIIEYRKLFALKI